MSPRVRILTTGGTIASTAGESGDRPTVTGGSLIDSVPESDEIATLEVESVRQKLSFHLDFDDFAAISRAARRASNDGVDGIVVTHGTDTLEESSYYLDLVTSLGVPVVFTGAQRSADRPGTDGPTNLRDAIRTAADERFREGVFVAFNERVHAARRVTKRHASNLDGFASPEGGPVAEFSPDGLRLLRQPESESVSLPESAIGDRLECDARIEIIASAAGVDGAALERAIDGGADGVVLAASGVGNTTCSMGDALGAAIERRVPVVVATRCYAGGVGAIYGGGGGSRTLRRHGAIPASDLPPWKARVKLGLAATAADGPDEVGSYFTDGYDNSFTN